MSQPLNLHRHDLLQLTTAGYDHAITAIEPYQQAPYLPSPIQLFPQALPPIVRAQIDTPSGLVAIGFASHMRQTDGVRLRGATFVPATEILARTTPFQIADQLNTYPHLKLKPALKELLMLAQAHGLVAGFFGSCALALVTGKPYLHPTSDIDVLLKVSADSSDLAGFYHCTQTLSQATGIPFDIEILCQNHQGAGIKLAEVMSPQTTVMAKSLYGPQVLRKQDIVWLEH